MQSNCICFPRKFPPGPPRLTGTNVVDSTLRYRRTLLERTLDAGSASEDDRLELAAILVEQLDRALHPLGESHPDSGPPDALPTTPAN